MLDLFGHSKTLAGVAIAGVCVSLIAITYIASILLHAQSGPIDDVIDPRTMLDNRIQVETVPRTVLIQQGDGMIYSI